MLLVQEARVIKDQLDDFLEHSGDYKLDDVEAQLTKLHTDFVRFKDSFCKSAPRWQP